MAKWLPYQFASWKGVLVQILPEPVDVKINGEAVYWIKLLSGYDLAAGKKPYLGDVTIARESDLQTADKKNLIIFKKYT